MQEMPEKDRRRSSRFEADGEVRLVFEGGKGACQGRLKDVSNNGLFARLPVKPDESWLYSGCRFVLLMEIEAQPLEIHGEAHVTRLISEGLGVFITTIDVESRPGFVRLMSHVRKACRQV
jgi:hypothetical protein